MRARIGAGLGAVLAAALLLRCSDLTEIVVAVDTDLQPGTDFDRVTVRVVGEGRDETKPGDVRNASALPVTLGITGGSNTSASVIVEATAFKGGASVARTTVTATMVDGHRKLLHISLCQSCPPDKQCGRSFGTSMPDYANALPTKHECDGIFADAGGFDSGTPSDSGTNDGGSTIDTGAPDVVTKTDAGLCGAACPFGTTCDAVGCHVDGEPTCGATGISVVATGVVFHGEICATKGTAIDVCKNSGKNPATTKAHVFVNKTAASIKANIIFKQKTLRANVVDGTCTNDPGRGCSVGGSGGQTIAPNENYGIALDTDTGCSLYQVRFDP